MFNSFTEWFEANQKCPQCGKNRVEAHYFTDYSKLKELIYSKNRTNLTIWHYFDFLPLSRSENIISSNEGNIGINHWEFLDEYAKKTYGIDCKVYVYRNDENYATHTFKDAGASLAASVLKECGIDKYIVASTGNVANAFAYYLAKADISLSAFIPIDALKMNGAGVSYYGQRVFRVNGDYAKAKGIAAEFAKKNNILMTGGNTDPLRIEAKRTMVFEWLSKLPEFPTAYVQALSGGTGPIAIDKAFREIEDLGLTKQLPRFLIVQPHRCAPMTEAWERAKKSGFARGWENDYPVYNNPYTSVPTLATGNPATYPIIGNLVKKSGGEITSFNEYHSTDIVRLIAYETQVRIGPASAIALGGFFDSLKKGHFRNGDVVLVNIGEGIDRAPEFFEQLIYTERNIDKVEDCDVFNRSQLRDELWQKIAEMD
ncbi:MAG: pyridoxal-phosphate dependent enzyme [Prevotellaceae bacterium]|nr:pyridoxal-phosphate dependent enzyme [Prevotellaceae bacterium]